MASISGEWGRVGRSGVGGVGGAGLLSQWIMDLEVSEQVRGAGRPWGSRRLDVNGLESSREGGEIFGQLDIARRLGAFF